MFIQCYLFLKGFIIKRYYLVILLIFACLLPSQIFAIEVVTHLHVPESTLTKSQLRRIYTMRQLRWSDQSIIKVFVLPSQHALHHDFAKEHLQMFPYQLNRIWHKLTYSGLGVAPTVVESEEELVQAVITTPGAIGYIDNKTFIKQDKNIDAPDMKEDQQIKNKGGLNIVKIKG